MVNPEHPTFGLAEGRELGYRRSVNIEAPNFFFAVACAAIQSASNVPEIKSEIDADALHVFSRRISM